MGLGLGLGLGWGSGLGLGLGLGFNVGLGLSNIGTPYFFVALGGVAVHPDSSFMTVLGGVAGTPRGPVNAAKVAFGLEGSNKGFKVAKAIKEFAPVIELIGSAVPWVGPFINLASKVAKKAAQAYLNQETCQVRM